MNEQEAQAWLEAFADQNMAEGDEYGGPVPIFTPDGFRGTGKELVVEFHVTLPGGQRLTTTRPLAYKDMTS